MSALEHNSNHLLPQNLSVGHIIWLVHEGVTQQLGETLCAGVCFYIGGFVKKGFAQTPLINPVFCSANFEHFLASLLAPLLVSSAFFDASLGASSYAHVKCGLTMLQANPELVGSATSLVSLRTAGTRSR